MGEQVDPYHVSSFYLNTLEVKVGKDLLIAYKPENSLPFEQSAVILVEPSKIVKLCSSLPSEVVKEIRLSSFKTKKVKVTLKLDENAFYDCSIEPIMEQQLGEAISNMSVAESTPLGNARIFFDEQSFTVFLNPKGKEYVVQNEDDCDKTPIYIAFNAKKPIIGKAAKDLYSKKPRFVVF
uniref:Uncharacterized protein n=1 Tax=Panagrolaimus sp. ES5 TaxID=591445 RepID=A0AC34GHN1_9BILA